MIYKGEKMLERKITMWVILYSFLYTIPKNYPIAKRARKNILKALKKQLKIYDVKKGHQQYLKLIQMAEKIMTDTKVKFDREELRMLNPGSLFGILEKRYPEYFEDSEINESWIKELKDKYIGTGNNSFVSIKYTNLLIENLENEVKDLKLKGK